MENTEYMASQIMFEQKNKDAFYKGEEKFQLLYKD